LDKKITFIQKIVRLSVREAQEAEHIRARTGPLALKTVNSRRPLPEAIRVKFTAPALAGLA
jgi:hypothetical protein